MTNVYHAQMITVSSDMKQTNSIFLDRSHNLISVGVPQLYVRVLTRLIQRSNSCSKVSAAADFCAAPSMWLITATTVSD